MSSKHMWGLMNWLEDMNLTKYYDKFKDMSYGQLAHLTKSELGKLCSPEDVDMLAASIEIDTNRLMIVHLLSRAYYQGYGVYFLLQHVEYILPSKFVPLLGRVSSYFVVLMRQIICGLEKMKSRPGKAKCIRMFCLYCFRGEQSEYFMMEDKDTLRHMRLYYQEEAKPNKKN